MPAKLMLTRKVRIVLANVEKKHKIYNIGIFFYLI